MSAFAVASEDSVQADEDTIRSSVMKRMLGVLMLVLVSKE